MIVMSPLGAPHQPQTGRTEPGARAEACLQAGKGSDQAGVICRGKVEASVLPSAGLGARLAHPLLSSCKNSPLPASLLGDSTRRRKAWEFFRVVLSNDFPCAWHYAGRSAEGSCCDLCDSCHPLSSAEAECPPPSHRAREQGGQVWVWAPGQATLY